MNREQRNRSGRQIQASTLFIFVGLALVVGFIGGTRKNELLALVGPLVGYSVDENYIDLSSVERTFATLKDNFDGYLDKEKLIEGASKGLTAAAGDN